MTGCFVSRLLRLLCKRAEIQDIVLSYPCEKRVVFWDMTESALVHQCHSWIGVFPTAEFAANSLHLGRHDPANSAGPPGGNNRQCVRRLPQRRYRIAAHRPDSE
jgi:hypothetical protein